ncbi:ABC-F family ATP-binding cassette domain-containing protein [Leekyejoonella antrihumi]|uniref:ABC-F family ATP-binding cassette domain-containing protein n=1 Tax=Leekyejoonella antrihumi TaxID=1660198 RepID=A0A563DVT5_9MICO|nr:ABC-F family ATP-binding cassette domain-containing protein [Leekyejoonella antrihumi]TWP34239.1 ABC-F family ATP-binding cassette domain-containing protein [Leekyejoonella antrihumi]
MPTPLQLTDITKTYADRHVLDGVDLTIAPGTRLGLVGENGAGKSTLLRIAAGIDPGHGGSVSAPVDLAYVAQYTGIDLDSTVAQVMHDALEPLHAAVTRLQALAARIDEPGAATAYDELLTWAQLHEVWDADRRAEIAATRLGLGEIAGARPAGSLSGGQRSRLALAAMLTRQPECVVLDEPTNHLDDAALDFLEDELRALHGSVLVASHDRVFLDRVCTAIVDLDPSHFGTDGDGGRRFTGDYTAYLQHKHEARHRWEEAFVAQQDELQQLRATAGTTTSDVAHNRPPRDNDRFIYGFKGSRVQATATRRVRNAEQRIAAVERRRIPKPPVPLQLSAQFGSRNAGSAALHDVYVNGRMQLQRLVVDSGDKVLVTGPNGAGKSTLLSLLAGQLRADRGSVVVQARSIGLLTQEVDLPSRSRSAHELYGDLAPGAPLHDLGLLHPRDLHRPAGELSIGQQRRLALALLVAQQPDLLLLDEPTNHLSLSLVDELESALTTTPVTVVIASHDRWLRQRWTGSEITLTPCD